MSNLDALLNSIREPGEAKTLTKEEEVKLGGIIQDPNTSEDDKRKAINVLVLKNIFLVLKLVHKYKRTSFDFEDLVSYGILGLFSAAKKYDPSWTNRFAAYARYWIRESVMKAIRECSGTPKIPVYLVRNLWAVSRVLSKNDDEISDEELARLSNVDEGDVTYLRSLLFKIVQFDPEYSEIDVVTPEDQYIEKERETLFLQELQKVLTAEEFIVLTHCFELCGSRKMTFSNIESEFYIKNPRKVKVDALRKLGDSTTLKMLYKER